MREHCRRADQPRRDRSTRSSRGSLRRAGQCHRAGPSPARRLLVVRDGGELGVEPEVLAEQAGRAPAAAAVLAQVLRTTPALPVEQALTVESLAYSLLLTGPEFRQWHESRRLPRASTQSDPEVLVRRDGPLLELVLNRPQVRNAYDAAMRDQLVEALALAVLDESVQRVLLRGNGSAFCSGGDLRDFGPSADL